MPIAATADRFEPTGFSTFYLLLCFTQWQHPQGAVLDSVKESRTVEILQDMLAKNEDDARGTESQVNREAVVTKYEGARSRLFSGLSIAIQ